MDYELPVKALLSIGDDDSFDILKSKEWLDYRKEYNLTEDDIPALIQMMTDTELLSIETDDAPYYAPIHALRALGQLGAIEAADVIIPMFHEWDNHELIWEDFPEVMSLLGVSTIPKLEAYLNDTSHKPLEREHAVSCLSTIAKNYPDYKATCITVLSKQLEEYETNGYELNAGLISALARMQVKEALPLIEKAYEADLVEEFIISLEDVHLFMSGEMEQRVNEALEKFLSLPIAQQSPTIPKLMTEKELLAEPKTKKVKAAKKRKHKIAKKSRKRNRK